MVSIAEPGPAPQCVNELATDSTMRPLLAWIIICHWAILFGALAAVSVLHPQLGPLAAFQTIGAAIAEPLATPVDPVFAILGASAVTIVTLMFAWALLSVAFAERGLLDDGVVTLAFMGGAALFAAGIVAGYLLPVSGHLAPLAIYLLALLASYLAIALPAPAQRTSGGRLAATRLDMGTAVRLATLADRPSRLAGARGREIR
jgi:hypothetical protein